MNHVEELRYLILAAQREGNRAFAAALRDRGLTPSQAEALSVLQVARRPLTVKEVGERLVCETGSPSRLMSMLIGKGLVDSSSDEGDRRVTRLTLSEQGALAAGGVKEAEGAIYELMEGLIAPRDAKRVSDLLRGLVGELPTGRALSRRIADGA